LILAALALVGAVTSLENGPVMVTPPDGPDGTVWIGAVVSELMPRALQRLGVPAVARADRLRVQEVLGVPTLTTTRATSIRVAESLGVSRLVVGSWEEREGGINLSVRLLDISRGTLSAPLLAAGPIESLGTLVHSLAWDVALAGPRAPGGTREALILAAQAIPFEALRAFGEGIVAREAGTRAAALRRALGLYPPFDEAGLALARQLTDAEEFEEARRVLGRIGTASPFARDARFLEGVALLGLGRYREAADLYARLVEAEPTAAARSNRAVALLRLGSTAPCASAVLREAAEAEPASAELPFNLGWALLVEGDAEAAQFWLRGVVRRDPQDAHARLVLSWALRRAGQADEAEVEWQHVRAARESLAALREPALSRRFERIFASERALLVDPEGRSDAELAATHSSRGEKLLAEGDMTGGVSELTRAALLDPYAARPHVLLARVHRARGELDKAVSELRMALWCRDDPDVRRTLAELLRSMGRGEEAGHLGGAP
jgi:tetratricopeptide (TPR) repeat protein